MKTRTSVHFGARWMAVGVTGLVAALIGGCPLTPWATVVLREDDSGSAVTVDVGATLMVILSGNMSTGYEWEVVDLNTGILEHTGTSYRPDCGMPGCGETGYWTFTAVSPGTTTLRMVYHRPWEDEEPARTFDLTVTVSGS